MITNNKNFNVTKTGIKGSVTRNGYNFNVGTVPFIITVDSGASGSFDIPTFVGTYDYNVNTSDGQRILGNTGDLTITFPNINTIYTIEISGFFPMIYLNAGLSNGGKLLSVEQFGIYGKTSTYQKYAFRGATNMVMNATDSGYFGEVIDVNLQFAWFNCSSMTSFPLIDVSGSYYLHSTWRGCTSLTSFPLIDTSSITILYRTWGSCKALTTFPLIDTSNMTSIRLAWFNCRSMTSFPSIDTSSVTNFDRAWYVCLDLLEMPFIDTSLGTYFYRTWASCASLTSFPALDFSSGTNFNRAWENCTSLTSFPALDFSSGTDFISTWFGCTILENFPLNSFDNCSATIFNDAFISTNLTEASIDGILVSIESNGTSNGRFDQSGGNAPSVTGEAAIDLLRGRGWTITVEGGY